MNAKLSNMERGCSRYHLDDNRLRDLFFLILVFVLLVNILKSQLKFIEKLTTVGTWRECPGGEGETWLYHHLRGFSEAFLDIINLSINSFAGSKLCTVVHLMGTFIIIHG